MAPARRSAAASGPGGRSLRAALLASAGWASWRVARSGHWSVELLARAPAHNRYWDELAGRQGEILYVALGDSSAQGIGAREPSGSYVGVLERELDARLQVVNLGISGARLSDVINHALPRLDGLALDRALVTFAAGVGDLEAFDAARFRAQLETVLAALPDHALVAELPYLPVRSLRASTRAANTIIGEVADRRGLLVIPLHAATRRLGPAASITHHAPDLLHPNDRGYRVWARAFREPASERIAAIRAADTTSANRFRA